MHSRVHNFVNGERTVRGPNERKRGIPSTGWARRRHSDLTSTRCMNLSKMSAVSASVCSGTFILTLAIAAYWDRTIRVLHIFESLPYLFAAILSLRQSKYGYALGFASGAFW